MFPTPIFPCFLPVCVCTGGTKAANPASPPPPWIYQRHWSMASLPENYFICQETLYVGSNCLQITWSPGSAQIPLGSLQRSPGALTGGEMV